MVVPELTAYLRNEFGSGGQKWLVVMWVVLRGTEFNIFSALPRGPAIGLNGRNDAPVSPTDVSVK
jgi:hypothetical protein